MKKNYCKISLHKDNFLSYTNQLFCSPSPALAYNFLCISQETPFIDNDEMTISCYFCSPWLFFYKIIILSSAPQEPICDLICPQSKENVLRNLLDNIISGAIEIVPVAVAETLIFGFVLRSHTKTWMCGVLFSWGLFFL